MPKKGEAPARMTIPIITPANATIEPTERSIPPVIITNVMPIEIIELTVTCCKTFVMLAGERNDLVSIASAAHNPIKTNKVLNLVKSSFLFIISIILSIN